MQNRQLHHQHHRYHLLLLRLHYRLHRLRHPFHHHRKMLWQMTHHSLLHVTMSGRFQSIQCLLQNYLMTLTLIRMENQLTPNLEIRRNQRESNQKQAKSQRETRKEMRRRRKRSLCSFILLVDVYTSFSYSSWQFSLYGAWCLSLASTW
ncbi:Ovule protein [Caenorhabditis elegans]|uniref:Ovule protein n=1 Tax=Caenorhabditis elegans TaxID=6239 RepID=Q9U3C2_CAEEL|nr:Ovule protein [Caenorhabditis elegans]CAA82661.3 Ovule protein [Caenorhabditis elegans]|eukprot:NP_499206.2 Uncharacterized protein CELE_K03H1.9 [Caenorhabditis elegans]